MSSRAAGLGLLVALAAWGCTAAPVGSSGAAIVDGSPATGDPGVVAIVPRRTRCGEGPQGVPCTGTLIAPRVVLTAAHCFELYGQEGRNYEVYFGPDALGGEGAFVLGHRVALHPDVDEDTHEHDVALLQLAAPAPVGPVDLPVAVMDESMVGARARVVGFGTTRDDTMPEGVKREGDTRITEVSATGFRAERDPAMTCQGDSGGPVFVEVDGVEQLLGVTASGDPGCDLEAFNVRVDMLLDGFIAPFAEEAATADVVHREGILPSDMLCGMECAAHEDCPQGMLCEGGFDGQFCRLLAHGPGTLGEECSADAECGGEGSVCARVWPGEEASCRCLDSCLDLSPPGDGDGDGCSAVGGAAGEAWWLVLGWIVARRRRG